MCAMPARRRAAVPHPNGLVQLAEIHPLISRDAVEWSRADDVGTGGGAQQRAFLRVGKAAHEGDALPHEHLRIGRMRLRQGRPPYARSAGL